MSQKGFSPLIIILGIILVIGIAGGAYYLGKSQISKPQSSNPPVMSQTPQPTNTSQTILTSSPSPDETATLKDFTDSAKKFTLKYNTDLTTVYLSSSYHQSSCTIFTNQQVGEVSVTKATPLPSQDAITLEACYSDSNLPSPENNIIRLPNHLSNDDLGPYYSVTNFTIGSYSGYKAKEKSVATWNNEADVVFLKDLGGGFAIIKRFQNGQKEFQEMLSTFKFTQ